MVVQKKDSTHHDRADLLLVTATDTETRAVLKIFVPSLHVLRKSHIEESTYFDLGVIAGTRVFLVQCEMGAGGPAGATLVVYEAITALSPSSVIMVGIAFGLDPEKQRLGDILVARQLVGYELQKIEQGLEGQEIIRPRGDRVQSSPRLLSWLRASSKDWQGPGVHFGLLLSGEKLVNNKSFRNKLLGIEREAIGGEMEGTGVYSAASRKKVDWILVKAICDWADGHKDDTRQQLAAENAARFLLHILQQQGPQRSNAGLSFPVQPPGETPLRKQAPGTTLCTYTEHASWVLAIGWEPEGQRIASTGGDGTVRVWDSRNGQTLLTYHGHAWLFERVNWPPKIYMLAWSPEGLRIASSGDGRKVHVWDAASGQIITEYEGHTGVWSAVFTLTWSPDGKRIASACSTVGFDKTIHVWATKTGKMLLRYNSRYGAAPNFSVSSVAWSPQADQIASACGDKTIRFWDAATGKHLSSVKASSNYVYTIAWSPDGRQLALAHANNTAEILDASTGRSLCTYHGHRQEVRDIAWSPDGKRLATASNDTMVKIWDVAQGTCLYTYEEHVSWTTSVAWSPDGTRVASSSNDKTVHIWQAPE
ncbi:MAG TPA: hypothetical protein VGF67_31790 [Ktedonobacteraceae bacterium]|jgi:WD40 repeat protein